MLLDYNHSDGPCVFLAAVEALKEMGAERFHEIAKEYWDRVTESARRSGIAIPAGMSTGGRADSHAIYDFRMKRDAGYGETQQELSKLGDAFLCCWDTELPELAIKWIETNQEPNQTPGG